MSKSKASNKKALKEETLAKYKMLHELAIAYAKGDKKAGESLIKYFDKFIWKYVNLVKLGVLYPTDMGQLTFVKLFTPNFPRGKSLSSYRFDKIVKACIDEALANVVDLSSLYTEDEIRNEFICQLLEIAISYSQKNYGTYSFHTYIDRIFHFRASRALKKLTKDPIIRSVSLTGDILAGCDYIDIDMIIDQIDAYHFNNKVGLPLMDEKFSTSDDRFLNNSWIMGVTCSENFSFLTPHERYLLVEHFCNGRTDTDISNEMGLCRATINRRRLSAIKKLSGKVKCVNLIFSNRGGDVNGRK